MDILKEIQQEEKELQCLLKDWGWQKTENFINELILKDRKKQLSIQGVSNCPNLTNLWNEAVFKQERNEHSIFDTNDCWGALRTLEKHGLCKINNY